MATLIPARPSGGQDHEPTPTRAQQTAWFGVLTAALLPSLLMLWSYTTKTGLTVTCPIERDAADGGAP